MTGRGSSLIVKSGIEVAGSIVTVDGKERGGAGGLGSPKLLADKERLAGGGDAVSLKVDVDDGVSGGGPSAGNGHTEGDRVDSLGAGEVLDVTGRISLGIGGSGGDRDGGRVGGPNADSGVDSLDSDGVSGRRVESVDVEALLGRGVGGGDSRDDSGHVNAVEVEGVGGRIAPQQADGDDVSDAGSASVDQASGGRWLRIGRGGSSGSGDGVGPRVGVGARFGPSAARGPGVGERP